MKFDSPAGPNAIDERKSVGITTPRIDGRFKTTGTVRYAYERHDVAPDAAYGVMVGAAIAKGRIKRIDTALARAAPGVIAVLTAADCGPLGRAKSHTAPLFGGPQIDHYDQALAVVVAETFEQARAAARLVRIDYARSAGQFDLAAEVTAGREVGQERTGRFTSRVGEFERAFADAPVTIDTRYTTPDQSHAMMEPHASVAHWDGGKLTLWTSNQMIAWAVRDLSETLKVPKTDIRVVSPYVGGGFGAKLWVRSDAVLAALAARATGRAVKVALTRPQIANNTIHRPATMQRIRLGAARDGRLLAIGHESWSGDLPGGSPESATQQTRLLYAGANRMVALHLAMLDLPEGNAMRAPGEASGLMALEIAMDELAEKLGMDPVELRILNDTQVDPEKPGRPFSSRNLVECLRTGAKHFGWNSGAHPPGQRREGEWLVGTGVAVGLRNNVLGRSAARVHLSCDGAVTVETDMTDIGTGSYTIIAQTAAEVLGVTIDQVTVRLGDSDFPVSTGSGGQLGAANSTAGVFAAAMKLREAIVARLGMDIGSARFEDGHVKVDGRSVPIGTAARDGGLIAEDVIEYGDIASRAQQSTFAAHFVEVAVQRFTGEVRVRRMLAVCDAGRILNPLTARSQVIGAMTMGVGAALMEALVVDKRFGFFVNHDLAGYEVPVHADVPHQEVIFLDRPDAMATPMKAKGVGELGLCGVAAAIANAIYNATGVRVREYPITLEKHLEHLPALA